MRLKIKSLGDYWPTMVRDCMDYARRCHQCQIHGNFIHQQSNPLHPMVASWSFERWGTYIIGPIKPPSSKGHRFILAAPDYFLKWSKAIPLREFAADNVIKFFKVHVIYQFRVLRVIRFDYGPSFRSFKV